MSFRMFQDFGFTGQPSDSQLESIGLSRVYSTSRPEDFPLLSYNNPVYVLNYDGIKHAVDLCAVNGWPLIWDLEGEPLIKLIGSYTDIEIDATLQMLEDVYNVSKSVNSSVPVGYYHIPPGTFTDYYAILNYFVIGGAYKPDYDIFVSGLNRLNYRWNGSSYDYHPLSNFMDFYAPSFYPLYYTASGVAENNIVMTEVCRLVKNIFGGGKPIYGYLSMFSYDDVWVGKNPNASEMTTYLNNARQNMDAGVMWGGFGCSYRYNYHPILTTAGLGDWKTITDGSFNIRVEGQYIEISGLNFSSVSSFDQIAAIIESNINATIDSSINTNVPLISQHPSFSTSYPFLISHVHVSYVPAKIDNYPSVAHFRFYSEGNYPGTIQPPDDGFYRMLIIVSQRNTPPGATNIADDFFLGPTLEGSYTTRNSDEWNNGWVVGTEWWAVLSNQLLSFTTAICQPMWADDMWATNTWTDDQWYNCSSSEMDQFFKIIYDTADLINTVPGDFNLISVYSVGDTSLFNNIIGADINFITNITHDMDMISNIAMGTNLLSSTLFVGNFNSILGTNTDLILSAKYDPNLAQISLGTTIDLIDLSSHEISLISVYNTIGSYQAITNG